MSQYNAHKGAVLGLVVVVVVSAALWLPAVARQGFLADDWAHLLRGSQLQPSAVPRIFMTLEGGWYRPLATLVWAVEWHLFGLNPGPYHVLAWMGFVLLAGSVGMLAWTLSRELVTSLLAMGVFASLAYHSEPILWLSASNEVLAGVPLTWAAIAFVACARGSRAAGVAVIPLLLVALSAKETAVFLPVWFILFLRVEGGDRSVAPLSGARRRLALITGSGVMVAVIFVVLRLTTGSPYDIDVGVKRLPLNALYYTLVGLLGMPEHYGYMSEMRLWLTAPALAITAMVLTGTALLLCVMPERRTRPRFWRVPFGQLAIGWAVLALVPVLLTATGRTLLLPSVGIALAFAGLLERRPRTTAAVALTCLLVAQWLIARERMGYWETASAISVSTSVEVGRVVAAHRGEVICLEGMPEHVHHAYLFQNAVPAMAELLWRDATVYVATTAPEPCTVTWRFTSP